MNIESTLGTNDADEIEKTEQEIVIQEKELICPIHKGIIEGVNYICPKCKTNYCLKCATLLAERNEPCWVCEERIHIEPQKY